MRKRPSRNELDVNMNDPANDAARPAVKLRFSLRTLLIAITGAAVAIAMVANYPNVILAILAGLAWFLFTTGIIFHVTLTPIVSLLVRIPYFPTVFFALIGIASSVIVVILAWVAISNYSTLRIVAGASLFAALFVAFSALCFRAAWLMRNGPLVLSDGHLSSES